MVTKSLKKKKKTWISEKIFPSILFEIDLNINLLTSTVFVATADSI